MPSGIYIRKPMSEKTKEKIGKAHRGAKFYNWKGGRRISDGYVWLTIYSNNPFYSMSARGKVGEHRLVMAQSLGRCLTSAEVVHHKNGNRADNRIENLELLNCYSHYPVMHLKELQKENDRLREEIKVLKEKLNLSFWDKVGYKWY